MTDTHRCTRFRRRRIENVWRDKGVFREREIEKTTVCAECGRERPSRFRKILAIEKEAKTPILPAIDLPLRRLARLLASLSKKRQVIRAGPLMKRVGGVRVEAELERLASCGSIRLIYQQKAGGLRLESLHVLDPNALSELASPGAAAKRVAALTEAQKQLATLTHPEALAIRDLLITDPQPRMDERVIKSLAGLACLIESEEALPARAFSARVLGYSKALAPLRNRLERLVGPLERLGIRDYGGLVLVGGNGILRFNSAQIDLKEFRCVAFSSEDVLQLRDICFPHGGVLVIENLTPFQAYLEQLSSVDPVLVIWSGGFPNRGVRRMLTEAAARSSRVRVWCDIDLGGVTIARQIHRITSGAAEPVLMEPSIVQAARIGCPLSESTRAEIMRDIRKHPSAILSETLHAVLQRSAWIEQETLLGEFFP